MKLFSLAAATALSSLALTMASAQDLPPRTIGSLDINAITSAPLVLQSAIELDADPAEVFATIADNQNWVAWFDSLGGVDGDGQARTFTFADGQGSLSETIMAFDEPSVFAWSMQPGNPLGLQNHLGVLHVTPDTEDGEGTVVTLSAFYTHAAPNQIISVMEGGSAAITAGLLAAHGGEINQQITGLETVSIGTSRVINVPMDAVWGVVVEDFGGIAQWSSLISEATLFRSNASEHDGLLGASRTCFIPAFGSEVQERVLLIDRDAGRFEYEVIAGLPPFASNGLSAWRFEDLGNGTTLVTSTVTMDIGDGTPGMAVGLTKSNFGQVLALTIDELEYFVETGAPHPREIASRN